MKNWQISDHAVCTSLTSRPWCLLRTKWLKATRPERSYSDGYVMEESEGLELVEPELAEEEPPASDGLEVPMEVEKRELALPSQNLSRKNSLVAHNGASEAHVEEPEPAQPAEPANPTEEEVEVGMLVPLLCHHPVVLIRRERGRTCSCMLWCDSVQEGLAHLVDWCFQGACADCSHPCMNFVE